MLSRAGHPTRRRARHDVGLKTRDNGRSVCRIAASRLSVASQACFFTTSRAARATRPKLAFGHLGALATDRRRPVVLMMRRLGGGRRYRGRVRGVSPYVAPADLGLQKALTHAVEKELYTEVLAR